MNAARTALVALLVLGMAPAALAHHPQTVSRLDVGGSINQVAASAVPAPRVDLGLSYSASHFGTVRQGSGKVQRANIGSATLQQMTLQARATVATATYLGLALPLGWLATRPGSGDLSDAEPQTTVGPGDLRLFVGQDVLRLFGGKANSKLALMTQVGLTLPTGSYDRNRGFVHLNVVNNEGALAVATYATRASLGAGAPAGQASVQLWAQPHSDWRVAGEVTASVPLGDTPDGIRWGRDLSTAVNANYAALENWLGLSAGADYRRHESDRMPAGPADLSPAKSGGRRQSLGARAAVNVQLPAGFVCSLSGRVPLWQHVQGVQLVESLSVSGGCSVGVGL